MPFAHLVLRNLPNFGRWHLFPSAYTGKAFDKATGLQNNLNRWYDASVGRWLSEDPSGLGPDSNPYRYVGNKPMNATDPSGLWLWPWDPNASWNPYTTASLWTGIPANQFPHGIGVQGSLDTAQGAGGGTAGQVFGGGGVYTNGAGVFAGGGGFEKDACFSTNNTHAVIGWYQGCGASVYLTNAANNKGIGGPFQAHNFYVGIGPIKFSAGLAIDQNGTWMATFGPPQTGLGVGLAGSTYRTDTYTLGW